MVQTSIRNIQYYEQAVFTLGNGFEGSINTSIPKAEVDLHKLHSFETVKVEIDLRGFPQWEELLNYIRQRAEEKLKDF